MCVMAALPRAKALVLAVVFWVDFSSLSSSAEQTVEAYAEHWDIGSGFSGYGEVRHQRWHIGGRFGQDCLRCCSISGQQRKQFDACQGREHQYYMLPSNFSSFFASISFILQLMVGLGGGS
jgi:hypothetical protein